MDKLVETLKDAELGPTEVARLLNISRVTVSLWMNEHNRPHSLISSRVQLLLDVLRQARQEGLLPMPNDLSRRERRDALEAIVDGVLELWELGEIEEELQH